MIYLIAAAFACTVALLTVAAVQLVPARPTSVTRRLMELEQMGTSPFDAARRRERQTRRQRLEGILQQLGARGLEKTDISATRAMLMHAGYRGPNAVAVYRGTRTLLPLALGGFGLLIAPVVGNGGFSLAVGMAALTWIAPAFVVGSRVRSRQKDIQKSLPDALDAMVVCVEAGLGLNQAMVRVADEIRHISVLLSDELAMVNLEIRAGTPREEALRNLAERTGQVDVRSLVTMLIQTDRFGTSIAQALRVQSDTLREKRRQRAEEAAAKTAIKMLFPLVFLIFPAMFVITLGPPMLKLIEGWSQRPIP
jgi:tight adherence protein C